MHLLFANKKYPSCVLMKKEDICTTPTPDMLPKKHLSSMLIVTSKLVPIEVMET